MAFDRLISEVGIAAAGSKAGGLQWSCGAVVVTSILGRPAGSKRPLVIAHVHVGRIGKLSIVATIARIHVSADVQALGEFTPLGKHIDHPADGIAAILDGAGPTDHFHAPDGIDGKLVEEWIRTGKNRSIVDAYAVPEIHQLVPHLATDDWRSLRSHLIHPNSGLLLQHFRGTRGLKALDALLFHHVGGLRHILLILRRSGSRDHHRGQLLLFILLWLFSRLQIRHGQQRAERKHQSWKAKMWNNHFSRFGILWRSAQCRHRLKVDGWTKIVHSGAEKYVYL